MSHHVLNDDSILVVRKCIREMDAVFVFSACPQDMIPVNGEMCTPTEAHFVVVG